MTSSAFGDTPQELALAQRARELHERVLVLDTHVDFTPEHLTGRPDYRERIDTQCNLPAIREGGVDALFLIVFVGQTREQQNPKAFQAAGYDRAYSAAVEKFEALRLFAEERAASSVALALSAADVRRLHARGRKAALIGVENGYPLGEDPGRLAEFFARGARYLSLAHNGHNQLSDSHTGERDGWKWHGLSGLGRRAVLEMNRLGIMVDVSHASKDSMMQTAALSRAPVIASHSAVRSLCDVSRNLDDEQLRAVGDSGGVVQIVAYDGFIKKPKSASAERAAALSALRTEYNLPQRMQGEFGPFGLRKFSRSLTPEQLDDYRARAAAIDREFPDEAPATVADLADHIDYSVALLGIDHVGIASDFDGGGGVTGWNHAGETFNVTVELVRRGYGDAEIAKLWGGNLLRVMEEVQHRAED